MDAILKMEIRTVVEINEISGQWQVVDHVAWDELYERQSVVKSQKVSKKVTYAVSVDFPENTVCQLPIWGTALPDSDHPSGRWSAGVFVEGDRIMLEFAVDPEIVLHTGCKIELYRGPNIVLTATIL